jgi:phage/plasmid-like protein (TIGR03299 family)
MATFSINDNLEWTVSHRPMYFSDQKGKPVVWPEKVAVVRDDNDKILGAVHPDFETVQNSELKTLVDPMVEEGLLTIANMGYLNGGSRVFIQAEVSKEFKVVEESYKSYITLTNGHIGNSSVKIGPSTVRIICGNTFTMANSQISTSFRHRNGVNQRILETKAVSDYVTAAMDQYTAYVEQLVDEPCSMGAFQEAVTKIFNKEAKELRIYEQLEDLFKNGAGNAGKTYYDAFNAITDFSSNKSRRTPEGRFFYANFGAGSDLGQRAMSTLLEIAA